MSDPRGRCTPGLELAPTVAEAIVRPEVMAEAKEGYGTRAANPERWTAIRGFAGRSVLDVGCGNGTYVLRMLKEHPGQYDPFGCDRVPYESWRQAPGRFAVFHATELGFRQNQFDTILSFETLEHVADPERTLCEFRRVCRRNVIVTVPNCAITPGMKQSSLILGHWTDRSHVNFFDLEGIAALVRRCGFRIRSSGYINRIHLLPFLAEAFRLSGFPGMLLRHALMRRQNRFYYLTCLVVGEKDVS